MPTPTDLRAVLTDYRTRALADEPVMLHPDDVTALLALTDEVERLRADLNAAQERSIEARNPGIDMDEVRATRARPVCTCLTTGILTPGDCAAHRPPVRSDG